MTMIRWSHVVPWQWRAAGVVATALLLGRPAIAVDAPSAVESAKPSEGGAGDTTGMALVQWAWDSWTAPWVQTSGTYPMLAPSSHATLMALACETASLERDRLARHLNAEECEHRMAAIRSVRDTALIFRVDLRVFDFRGSDPLARLGHTVTFTLEDDRGRHWSPIETTRGPAVMVATGQRLKRIYYHPPWLRADQHLFPAQYGVADGRNLTVGEHRVSFPKRDPHTRELVVSRSTQWLRLRLSYPPNEWVATWTFRPDEGRSP